MNTLSLRSVGLALLVSPFASADAAQSESRGFIEDSNWSLLNRTVFDQRDYKHGARNSGARNAYKPRDERNGKAEEWAYGLMGTYQSGFTQGMIGVGIDAHAYLGVQLDSGGGRAGKARLLGVDNDGRPKNEFSRGRRRQSTSIEYRAFVRRAAVEDSRVQFLGQSLAARNCDRVVFSQ